MDYNTIIMQKAYDDVDLGLLRTIPEHNIPNQYMFFYIARRHWIEIVPEFIQSIYLSLISLALTSFLATELRYWIFGILGVTLSLIWPFGIECWRWRQEVVFLTQTGVHFYRFDLRTLTASIVSQDLISSSVSKVSPLLKHLLGVDAGYIVTKSADSFSRFTPLLPEPGKLQARIGIAKGYKPSEYIPEKDWVE